MVEMWKNKVKQAIDNSILFKTGLSNNWCAKAIIKYNETVGDKQKTQQDHILGDCTESKNIFTNNFVILKEKTQSSCSTACLKEKYLSPQVADYQTKITTVNNGSKNQI